MRHLTIFMALCALCCIGCQHDTITRTQVAETEFIATFDDAQTRVYLGDDYYFRWELDNRVSVFEGNTLNREYATAKADVIVSPLVDISSDNSTNDRVTSNNYAVFPYRIDNDIVYDSEGGCVIRSYINDMQYYRANKTNLNSALMVSKTEPFSNIFVFRNSCALIKINIKTTEKYADTTRVKSIVVGSRYRDICGPVTIDMNEDYTAHIDNDINREGARSKNITLNNVEDAGTLNTQFKSFYVAIPAEDYQADEITIKIDAEDDRFDYVAVVNKAYNLKRSEYIELYTTIDPDKKDSWVDDDETDGDVGIKDDVTLVNKAIMTYAENMIVQGFYGQDQIQTILPIPTGDFTVDGDFLVEGNSHTITFTATDKADFVMNTFTTLNSGYKDIVPPTVTVNDLTITGELRCTTLGVYCSSWMPMYGNRADQKAFSTVWNNVNVVDNKIVSYTNTFASAVIAYGTAVLNNCQIYGTERSSLENPPIAPNIFDMYSVNNSNTTINGGRFGNIGTTEHAAMTINDGAVIDNLHWWGNGAVKTTNLVVNRADIGTLHLPSPYFYSYPPRIFISKEANIDVINITMRTKTNRIVIEDGAQIGKVIDLGEEMTLEEFIAKYNITVNY